MSVVAPDASAESDRARGTRLARLYERDARALYGLCVMLLRDAQEAEDALQSAFLSAHGALLRGAVPRDDRAWLAAIARNECRARVRARMETPLRDDPDQLRDVADPSPPFEETIPDPTVGRAFAALSEKQRDAVVLHDVLGLRSREVGAVLGLSRPAVEALLFRARRQLRLRLKPVGILVVPAAVGHALAQALPGFVAPAAAAGIVGSTGSAAGVGVLAKLAATPTAAKITASVAAAATAGSIVAVEVARKPVFHHPAGNPPRAVPVVAREGDHAPTAATGTSRMDEAVVQDGAESSASTRGSGSGEGRDDGSPVRHGGRSDSRRHGGNGSSGPGSGADGEGHGGGGDGAVEEGGSSGGSSSGESGGQTETVSTSGGDHSGPSGSGDGPSDSGGDPSVGGGPGPSSGQTSSGSGSSAETAPLSSSTGAPPAGGSLSTESGPSATSASDSGETGSAGNAGPSPAEDPSHGGGSGSSGSTSGSGGPG